jgi:hypothetical protein
MKTMLICAVLAAALAAAGCITKGPYYVYGDYIENFGDVGFEEIDECPPEETAPGEEAPVAPSPEGPDAEETI